MLEPKVVRTLAFISQIGISMMVPVFMMLYVGLWIEEQFDVNLILFFILLGIAAGLRNCYILFREFLQKDDSDN